MATLGLNRLEPTGIFDSSVGPSVPDFIPARRYYDDRSSTFPATSVFDWLRKTQPQENGVIQALAERGYMPNGFSEDTIVGALNGWMVRGAVREDDNDALIFSVGGFEYWSTTDDRDADPHGPMIRATKHFYDPVFDRALTYQPVCNTYQCAKSILWATGTTAPLSPLDDLPDPQRRNHFTWVDARNNFFSYLALQRDRDSNGQLSALERRESSLERIFRMATAVKSVGHVIHLLQDTAQPQHVRNDAHAPPREALGLEHADASVEAYTEYRLTGNEPSGLTIDFLLGNPLRSLNESLPAKSATPELVLGNYPATGTSIQFSTPVKFFTTRHVDMVAADCGDGTSNVLCARRGLADMSNRSFFTSGTMPYSRVCSDATLSVYAPNCPAFLDNPHPQPSIDVTRPGYSEILLQSPILLQNRQVIFSAVSKRVLDNVAPSYVDASLVPFQGKVPLILRSAAFYAGEGLVPQALRYSSFTYSYTNMRYTADVAIPRAIGYSAGMIDFFFRGRITVEAPVDGLFAAIDHSIPHTVDSDGYPRCSTNVINGSDTWCTPGRVYGFTKIRLKLRNSTGNIVESGTGAVIPQTLVATVANPTTGTNAGLYAVARYHRNPCYRPDLSGEVRLDANGQVANPVGCSSNRTNFQEISVSRPKVASAAELNGATSSALTFDFSSDPIPINATDLIFQVFYRGQLGEESDGIAVGSFDVREPSYVTLWNNSDWGACNNAWVQSFSNGCTPSSGTTLRVITTANLCVGSQILLAHNGNIDGNLTLGRYLRVAVVMDDRTLTTRARTIASLTPTITDLLSRTFLGQRRQSDREIITLAFPFVAEPIFQKRGRLGSLRPMPIHIVSGTNPQPLRGHST